MWRDINLLSLALLSFPPLTIGVSYSYAYQQDAQDDPATPTRNTSMSLKIVTKSTHLG
jgi:hypothetical protein